MSARTAPELGAAGLVAAAGGLGGASTEVERQAVTTALMRLFRLPGPRAAALRAEAEALRAEGVDLAGLAAAAAGLGPDDRDQLVTTLWSLDSQGDAAGPALAALAEALGTDGERLEALRPR